MLVPVPETAVNKDDLFAPPHDKVRTSRERAKILIEAQQER